MAGFAFEPPLGPPGFSRVLKRERKPYRTKDGFACILPYSNRNWRDFYAFTGRDEFVNDERFERLSDRVIHIAILYKMVEEEALRRTTGEWVEFCDRVGIPCMPVLALKDLPEDEQVKAVGLFDLADHPTEGRYRSVRRPILFSKSSFCISRHAPRHGEHTTEVLKEVGLSSEQIDRILTITRRAFEKLTVD